MTLVDRTKKSTGLIFVLLLIALLVTVVVSAGLGAVEIRPMEVLAILASKLGMNLDVEFTAQQEAVLMALRLPRVLMGLFIGAGLAVSGAAMQGLFRNPLADPGLLGISSGASFFVGLAIIANLSFAGIWTLPIAAFTGSILAIILIYSLAQQDRKTNIATMLLAGIAINALCEAGTGLFTYMSTDEQLRTITFWQMGSLGGASWTSLGSAAPLIAIAVFGMPFLASALNALLLGESNARHLGVSVEKVKWFIVILIGLGVGAGVAVAGRIGFVGLVIPHVIRLFVGANHRAVLPLSAVAGALLLLWADLISRTIASPAELPIGILTSMIGGPFFLYLLMNAKKRGRL